MKFLYMIFVVIFISGSFAFSQEEQKEENSYPKFIPYIQEVNNLQANIANMDIRDYGKEQPARWLSVDPMANKYPGWSPYNYVMNNPLRNIDPHGDSLVAIQISKDDPYIHGDKMIFVDHRYATEVQKILLFARVHQIHLKINQSFRTNEEQMGDNIQKNGITPAKLGSRHVAGLAIDYNLYQDNNYQKGTIFHNNTVTNNNPFTIGIKNAGSRWGGNISDPDKVHFDAGTDEDIKSKYGTSFQEIRDEDQEDVTNGKLIPIIELNK